MYSLKCDYYSKEFATLTQLIDDVVSSDMDPYYEILKDGKGTGEYLSDLLVE